MPTITDPVVLQATQEAYERQRDWLTRPGARQAFSAETEQCMYIVPTEPYEVERYDDEELEMETIPGLPPDVNGLAQRCAIGCLLSDEAVEEVRTSDEGVQGILINELVAEDLANISVDYMTESQALHDANLSWDREPEEKFRVEKLDALAASFGLRPFGSS
jgi:hypothetical protein